MYRSMIDQYKNVENIKKKYIQTW